MAEAISFGRFCLMRSCPRRASSSIFFSSSITFTSHPKYFTIRKLAYLLGPVGWRFVSSWGARFERLFGNGYWCLSGHDGGPFGPFAHGLSLDEMLEEQTGWWEEVESALRSHAGRTIGVDGLRAHGDGWLRCSNRT